MCDPNSVVNCTSGSGYCGTSKVTDKNGTVYVIRGCDGIGSSESICPIAEKYCIEASKRLAFQACAAAVVRQIIATITTPPAVRLASW